MCGLEIQVCFVGVFYEAVVKILAGAAVTWWLDWAGRSTSKRLTPMVFGWRAHLLTSCFQNTRRPPYRSAPQSSWLKPKQVIPKSEQGPKESTKSQGLLWAILWSCTVSLTLYLLFRSQLLSPPNANGKDRRKKKKKEKKTKLHLLKGRLSKTLWTDH